MNEWTGMNEKLETGMNTIRTGMNEKILVTFYDSAKRFSNIVAENWRLVVFDSPPAHIVGLPTCLEKSYLMNLIHSKRLSGQASVHYMRGIMPWLEPMLTQFIDTYMQQKLRYLNWDIISKPALILVEKLLPWQ